MVIWTIFIVPYQLAFKDALFEDEKYVSTEDTLLCLLFGSYLSLCLSFGRWFKKRLLYIISCPTCLAIIVSHLLAEQLYTLI